MIPLLSILVVDDDSDHADSLDSLLSMQGFGVRVSTSGRAALNACTVDTPEVVLIDLLMPKPDGWEVAQGIRSLPLRSQPAIFAITGCTRQSDIDRARDVGVDLFLVKPVQPQRLVQLLNSVRPVSTPS